MLKVQLNVPCAQHINLKAVTIPIDRYPQGYEAGFAGGIEKGLQDGEIIGRNAAEAEDAAEDAALLTAINDAIISVALNPLSCAQTLGDMPESVKKLYDQAYTNGKEAAEPYAEVIENVLYVKRKENKA